MWFSTLSLIFGGCCSNAITLEHVTSHYPNSGSLITFLQFFLISLHGLPTHLTWTRYGPRFKPRRIPLTPYLGQVALFYLISLLNNAAFAYQIPMPVHIIFRSGGLVISMLLGWLVSKKRYSFTQILSVLMVTLGVVLTTLSASRSTSASPSSSSSSAETNPYIYATGILILTVALIFSGFLGILQDWTYTKYGRPTTSSISGTNGAANGPSSPQPPPVSWQESMFYLHFLGLFLFLPLLPDLKSQISAINHRSPRTNFSVSLPSSITSLPFINLNLRTSIHISIPTPYLPLLLNTLTQLLCIAGVHMLTTRVSALTVTLVLVVRKAASLVLSVKGAVLWRVIARFSGLEGVGVGMGGKYEDVDGRMLWSGAVMVMAGTVGYTVGTNKKKRTSAEKAPGMKEE